MDDRITEIREALAYWYGDENLGFTAEVVVNLDTLAAAARAYVDLLDSDALIIRRDEAGNWPLHILNNLGEHLKVDPWEVQACIESSLLASSQGVEPPRYPDWRNADPDWRVEGVEPQ